MNEFPTQFRGQILTPDAPDFPTALGALVASQSVIAVVMPESVADVALAVQFAASQGVTPAIRSGGHSGPTYTPTSAAIVIDLARLDSIDVDGDVVRVGPGARWGAVAATLETHGLVLTSGDTASVGVGGLTLGGGVGWLVRQDGLTIDSLVEAEVVTSTGEIVSASASVNPDLFWGLRGGGGNFGVVTAFTFRARRLASVISSVITLEITDLAAAVIAWRDVMRTAPDQLTSTFSLTPAFGPEIPAVASIVSCWAGTDLEEARAALTPLFIVPGAISHTLESAPYPSLLHELPEMGGPPITFVDSASFTPELTDELAEAVLSTISTFGPTVFTIRYLGGAFSRVPADATAVAYRTSEALLFAAAVLPFDVDAQIRQRILDQWTELPGPRVGTFSTFISRTGPEILAELYPPSTLERLREIKRTWDPNNLFRLNQNVAP